MHGWYRLNHSNIQARLSEVNQPITFKNFTIAGSSGHEQATFAKSSQISLLSILQPSLQFFAMSLINLLPLMVDGFSSNRPLQLVGEGGVPATSAGYEEEEDEQCVRYSLDLPGVKASDLDVSFKDKYIMISGARRMRCSNESKTKRAKFQRILVIDPEKFVVTEMKANLADGVLVINIPKKPKAEPIKIEVTTTPHEEVKNDKMGDTKPEDKEVKVTTATHQN